MIEIYQDARPVRIRDAARITAAWAAAFLLSGATWIGLVRAAAAVFSH